MKKNVMCFALSMVLLALVSSCSTVQKPDVLSKQQNNMIATKSNTLFQNEKSDKQLLINKLVTAFADEWMAGYQYWMAARLVQGALRTDVIAELTQHYNDELRHADMIAKRLIELEGDFRMFPQDWHHIGGCHFDSITKSDVVTVLRENIKGEQCAIDFYQNLLVMVEGKDKESYDMVLSILHDEIEHKEDLEKLLKALPVHNNV